MSFTQETFSRWLEDDINYVFSDQVPVEQIYKSLNKGQMAKLWTRLVRVVRSQNVVAQVRGNLQLEKHRLSLVKNQLQNTTMNLTETTFAESDELNHEELKQDFLKCDRRLRKTKLERTTVEHAVQRHQHLTLELFHKTKVAERQLMEVLRSGYYISHESKRFITAIRHLDEQSAAIKSWSESVMWNSIPTGQTGSSVTVTEIIDLLKNHLVKAPQQTALNANLESTILDWLQSSSPISSRQDLLNQFRELNQRFTALISSKKINAASQVNHGSEGIKNDTVRAALLDIWRSHFDSHVRCKQVEAEVLSWRDRCEKAMTVITADHPAMSSLFRRYLKLRYVAASAEAMLAQLNVQVADLQVECTLQHPAIMESIAKNMSSVQAMEQQLDHQHRRMSTWFAQASGFKDHISGQMATISQTKMDLLRQFFGVTNVATNLQHSANLPMTILSAFDELAFAPSVAILTSGPAHPCDSLSIYRLMSTHPAGSLLSIPIHLDLPFPICPLQLLEVLSDLITNLESSRMSLEGGQRLLKNFSGTIVGRKSDQLRQFLQDMNENKEKLLSLQMESRIQDWSQVVAKVKQEIIDWQTEPVKEIVRQDSATFMPPPEVAAAQRQPVWPLSKWYQDFHLLSKS